MARIIHASDAETAVVVGKLLTYNECPEHSGLTIRYTSAGSLALMVAFVFKGRCRHAYRFLTDAERIAYQEERIALSVGDGI